MRTGQVSLPDGGAKLAAALEQRRAALKSRGDVAAGRVLTFRDPGSGAVQARELPSVWVCSLSTFRCALRKGGAERQLVAAWPACSGQWVAVWAEGMWTSGG